MCRTTPGAGSREPRSVSPTSANASSQEIGSYLSVSRVIAQRLGEPANRLQVVVAPSGQLADGVARRRIRGRPSAGASSHVTCLMPFSQMSRWSPSGSSGQAQPGQSKPPSSWFITKSARTPSIGSAA